MLTPLLSEQRMVVVPRTHRLAGRRELRPSDLGGEIFVTQPDSAPQEWRDFWMLVDELGYRPPVSPYVGEKLEEWLHLIGRGEGIDTCPAIISRYYAWPEVRFIPLVDAPLSTLVLARHSEARQPLIAEFVALAGEVAANAARNPDTAYTLPEESSSGERRQQVSGGPRVAAWRRARARAAGSQIADTVGRVREPLDLVESIPGWLLPEDAALLHELAGETGGPVLEIGTYRGRSAVLMATAIEEAGGDAIIYSVDIGADAGRSAAVEAGRRGLAHRLVFARGTLAAFARAYPRLRPTLTFVDGDHTREGVERDLAVLRSMVPAGATIVFHDYADPRNDDPACAEVKVRPAVAESWVSAECDLVRTAGVCGVFRRRTEPPPLTAAPTVDLLWLASPRERYRGWIRAPAVRVWRRLQHRGRAGQ